MKKLILLIVFLGIGLFANAQKTVIDHNTRLLEFVDVHITESGDSLVLEVLEPQNVISKVELYKKSKRSYLQIDNKVVKYNLGKAVIPLAHYKPGMYQVEVVYNGYLFPFKIHRLEPIGFIPLPINAPKRYKTVMYTRQTSGSHTRTQSGLTEEEVFYQIAKIRRDRVTTTGKDNYLEIYGIYEDGTERLVDTIGNIN